MTDLILAPQLDGATALANFKSLQAMVKKAMVKGVDYYQVRGKDTITKSGAEKLCRWHSLSVELPENRVVAVLEAEFVAFTVVARICHIKTGAIVAEGIGHANSRERKYASQGPYEVANTLLKMAKKRAMIDATLTAVAASGMFTQDVGDDEPPGSEPVSSSSQDDNTTSRQDTPLRKLQGRYEDGRAAAAERGLSYPSRDDSWPLAELTKRVNEIGATIRAYDREHNG